MIEMGKLDSNKFRLSCSLFELIEIWSMRGMQVDIVYSDEESQTIDYSGKISDVYSRNGLEQVVLDGSLIIPTKNIVSINDVNFKSYLK